MAPSGCDNPVFMRHLPVLLVALALLDLPCRCRVRHCVMPSRPAVRPLGLATRPRRARSSRRSPAPQRRTRCCWPAARTRSTTPLHLTVGELTVAGRPGRRAAAAAVDRLARRRARSTSSAYDQTLRNLRVEGGVNAPYALVRTSGTVGSATLDRVQVRNAGSGTGVAVRTSLLRDSVVTSRPAPAAIAAIVTGTVTSSTLDRRRARRAGAVQLDRASSAATPPSPSATRSCAAPCPAGTAWPRTTTASAAPRRRSTSTRSSFGAGRLDERGTDTSIATGTANVTTVSPLLAGLPGGADIHQLRGSPTIDAGSAAPASGETRHRRRSTRLRRGLGHRRRRVPAAADRRAADRRRGRHERRDHRSRDAARVGHDVVTGVRPDGRLREPRRAAGRPVRPADSQSIGTTPQRLKEGTTYHVRLVGSSAKGTSNGPDCHLQDDHLADSATRRSPRVRASPAASLTHSSVRRGKIGGPARARSAQAGTLEIVSRGCRPATAAAAPASRPKRKRCTAAVRIKALSRKVLCRAPTGRFPIVTTGPATRPLPPDACRRQHRRQAVHVGRPDAARSGRRGGYRNDATRCARARSAPARPSRSSRRRTAAAGRTRSAAGSPGVVVAGDPARRARGPCRSPRTRPAAVTTLPSKTTRSCVGVAP